MTPGNVEFVQVLIDMTVWTGGVATILLVDGRRHTTAREREWLPATRDAAILGAFLFSVMYAAPALVVHFAKSRQGWLARASLGLLWALALLVADAGLQNGAAAAIDWLRL